MKKVLVIGKIPEAGYEALKNEYIEVYVESKSISDDKFCEVIRDKDALLVPLSKRVRERVIDAGARLKIIANFGAGYDNIAVDYAKQRGIVVTNTPGVSTEATAEFTLGLLLSVSRRIVEGDQLCRAKGFNGWAPLFFLGRELYQKKLGIIGLGSIGQAVAKRAKAFGMEVLYTGRAAKDEQLEKELGVSYRSLDELLQESDFVSINASYNTSTHHLLNKEKLSLMKKSAFLINAARGPIVHEADLVDALRKGIIAGAALDVYEFEPEISDELKTFNNVVLTPHIGNATIETRDKMARLAARNIVNVLHNEPALTNV
ncbi:MAG: NAD(P)-dependent oxidoreductase [Tuberibacillus sp.]